MKDTLLLTSLKLLSFRIHSSQHFCPLLRQLGKSFPAGAILISSANVKQCTLRDHLALGKDLHSARPGEYNGWGKHHIYFTEIVITF